MLFFMIIETFIHVQAKLYYIKNIASIVLILCQSIFVIHGNNLPAIDRCLLYIHVHVHYLEQPIFVYIVLSILGGALILSIITGLSSVAMRSCSRTQSFNHV